jgi:hypothetical protein
MDNDRALRAFEGVLPTDAGITVREQLDRDTVVEVAEQRLRIRWLSVGWPRQLKDALARKPRPDIVAAPLLSPGSRHLASQQGIGWLDESGAADISRGTLLISRDGTPPLPLDTRLGWRPAALAVCEALLTGCPATVAAVTERTNLATGTVVGSLKFLNENGLLQAPAARGRTSGRHVADYDSLLDAYAAAAERLRPPTVVRVGALWRDPMQGVVEAGQAWDAINIRWAATSALAAAAMAPLLTETTPIEIYVTSRTISDLRKSAEVAGLREIDGGRILLRPFPTPANDALTEEIKPGLFSVLWPRAYADLRTVGVRGEDAAEHLREEMSRVRGRATEVTGREEGR